MSMYDCAVCGEKRCEHVISDNHDKQGKINSLLDDNKALGEYVTKLEKCLELYANKNNWSEPYLRQGVIGFQVKLPLHRDGGYNARKVLGLD